MMEPCCCGVEILLTQLIYLNVLNLLGSNKISRLFVDLVFFVMYVKVRMTCVSTSATSVLWSLKISAGDGYIHILIGHV